MHTVIQRFVEALDYAPREQSKIIDAFEAIGLTDAALDVLAERLRQIENEGWSRPLDQQRYKQGELSLAAVHYADNATTTLMLEWSGEVQPQAPVPPFWPFAPSWWKPSTAKRDLEKAGALIFAQLDVIASRYNEDN